VAEPIERLLLADEETMRAAIAWDAIPKHSQPGHGLSEWSPDIHYDPALWMRVAGLRPDAHAAMQSRCMHLGFITLDGSVWAPILTVARTIAAKRIKAQAT
jgi:hypothetical protein